MHGNGGTAYFARAMSYACKMFMKLTTGANDLKLFFVTEARVFDPGLIFAVKARSLP